MENHRCCYWECCNPATIYIGRTGDPSAHWICEHHRDYWNALRARFIADGLPCKMKKLPMNGS